MGWSESHKSLTFQRCITFTPSLQQIFSENSIFVDFFLTVHAFFSGVRTKQAGLKDKTRKHKFWQNLLQNVQNCMLHFPYIFDCHFHNQV